MKGITRYSVTFEGSRSNYGWSVRFDVTDGILGISQTHDDGQIERVLLSKNQVNELLAFLRRRPR